MLVRFRLSRRGEKEKKKRIKPFGMSIEDEYGTPKEIDGWGCLGGVFFLKHMGRRMIISTLGGI